MNQNTLTTVRRLKLVLFTAGLLLFAHLARADQILVTRDGVVINIKGSHLPIPPDQNGPDTKQLFEQRLRELNQRDAELKQMSERLQKLLGEQKWKELNEKFKSGVQPNDPRFQEEMRKLIGQSGSGSRPPLSKEDTEQLRRWFEKEFPNAKLPGTAQQDPLVSEPAPREPPLDSQPPGFRGNNNERNGDLPDEAARAQAAEQIMRWARNLERVAGNLEDSPALQQALRDLSRSALEMQNSNLPREERLDTQLAQLSRHLQDSGEWLKDLRQSLGRVELPDLPRLNNAGSRLPSVDRFPSIHVPSRIGDLPSGMGGGQQLLALVLIVLVLVIAWKLSGRLVQAVVERGKAAWMLGPWPLDPAQIATRDDVVRCFEYLSLLRLGYQARSWNHLEIAGRLGGPSEDCRQAATALAALYEQARYAPGEEPFSADAIAAARQDVCFLAGVAAV